MIKELIMDDETILINILITDNFMIKLSTTLHSMFGKTTIAETYNLMDYSINDALFMFKENIKTR
jgi:hypothetical protein